MLKNELFFVSEYLKLRTFACKHTSTDKCNEISFPDLRRQFLYVKKLPSLATSRKHLHVNIPINVIKPQSIIFVIANHFHISDC